MRIDLNTWLPPPADSTLRRERRSRSIVHRGERCLMLGPAMCLAWQRAIPASVLERRCAEAAFVT